MNDPVANCFRFAKIEHGGMVARAQKTLRRTQGKSAITSRQRRLALLSPPPKAFHLRDDWQKGSGYESFPQLGFTCKLFAVNNLHVESVYLAENKYFEGWGRGTAYSSRARFPAKYR